MAIPKNEVITLNNRLALWLAVGIFTGTLAIAGCQKKEEPVPAATPAPAAGAPAGAGAVTPALAGSDVGPASSPATGETKPAEKQEAGTKKN